MKTPNVAVIIATKNRPALLQNRALNSVLNQSVLPNKLIIVDDSSQSFQTENRAIVASLPFSTYSTHYMVNKRTVGASGAWNTVIEYLSSLSGDQSESQFLAFLDDDDEWHEQYLENCLLSVSENNVNMVATGFYRVEDGVKPPIECLAPRSLREDAFLQGNPGIQGSNLFLSLNLMLKAGGFDEQLQSCTDRDLCIRLCGLSDTRYRSIDKLLLIHYAERNRVRLSNPNSPTKNNGLTKFWNKYYGLMSDAQRVAFCKRSRQLFGWQPESFVQASVSVNTDIDPDKTVGLERELVCESHIDATIIRFKKHFDVDDLRLLGTGVEGVVMTDNTRVFKCIEDWAKLIPSGQSMLLEDYASQQHDLLGLYAIDKVVYDDKALLFSYPYEVSDNYQGGDCDHVIDLLHSCSRAGIVCNNIHPKNLVKTQTEVKLIDYGSDIRPWSELGFEHMARRAYLTIYYADHPRLKHLMSESLNSVEFKEMKGYSEFRQGLCGIDCNLKAAQHISLPADLITKNPAPFSLNIGVVSADAYKLLPLLNSIAELDHCEFLSSVNTYILCNGCSSILLKSVLAQSKRPLGEITIISEEQQVLDAKNGLFGSDLLERQQGQVGIAHARSMLQKYIGLYCEENPESIAWILDDDMRIDARAKQYLAWLPQFKQANIDVLIGQYEGSSPNPPLNGLRCQLVDLLHNLRWLDKLCPTSELPDRSQENVDLRDKYPDYYYDLSRKHTAHVEAPFWIEPAYKGETVAEAQARLFAHSPLLLTGYPLTRSIVPVYSANPLVNAKDTVNRGGNTFILNTKALTDTPNLIPKFNGREARRSDMIWAILNKYHQGLSIKAVPFPVQHVGRVTGKSEFDLEKVRDEIVGSALYAGLQVFLRINEHHNLVFTDTEVNDIWKATEAAYKARLILLKSSFYRIDGLAQALTRYPQLLELCSGLAESYTPGTFATLEAQVKLVKEIDIHEFLYNLVPQSTRFANSPRKTFKS